LDKEAPQPQTRGLDFPTRKQANSQHTFARLFIIENIVHEKPGQGRPAIKFDN
jgi:hypothetical protein